MIPPRVILDLLPGMEADGEVARRDGAVVHLSGETWRVVDRPSAAGPGLNWVRGREAGGPVAAWDALALIRAVKRHPGARFLVEGLGIRAMAGALAVGAEGIVLGAHLWGAVPLLHRWLPSGLGARDTQIVGDVRVLARGAVAARRRLREGEAVPTDGWWDDATVPIPAPTCVGDARVEDLTTAIARISAAVAARRAATPEVVHGPLPARPPGPFGVERATVAVADPWTTLSAWEDGLAAAEQGADVVLDVRDDLEAAIAAGMGAPRIRRTVRWGAPVRVSGQPTDARSTERGPVSLRARDAEPIAIVGLGCALPGAPDVPAFWRMLVEGRHAIDAVDRWDPARYYDAGAGDTGPVRSSSRVAAAVRDLAFDPARFRIPPAVAATLDPVQRMALVAAAQAVEGATWRGRVDPRRAAVVLGNAMGGEYAKSLAVRVRFRDVLAAAAAEGVPLDAGVVARIEDRLAASLPPVQAETMVGLLANVVAGRVAAWLDWMGGSMTVDAACAASLGAVGVAVDWLRAGRVDLVITGGADADLAPETFVGFTRTRALSSGGSRPFSADSDGFVMGEGCAVLVLERLSDAIRHRDPVWAVIRGVGQSSDGRGRGIATPRPDGQRLAIERALAEAGPGRVGLVEAHGTGTSVGDPTEIGVLSAVLDGPAWVGSVKSNLGHLKGAAGAAGMLKATLAVATGVVPPTLHAGPVRPDLALGALRLPRVPTRLEGRAAVSAFGFGGTNFHVVLDAPPPEAARPDLSAYAVDVLDPDVAGWPTAPLRMWCFGADDSASLAAAVRAGHAVPPGDAARAPTRATVIARVGEEEAVRERLAAALADPASQTLPRRAFRGDGPPGRVGVLVPGQGAQRPGATRSLRRLAAGRRALAGTAPPEDGDTRALHALLPTLAIGWCDVLRAAGVPVHGAVGHSLGELGALVAAGMLAPADALRIAAARGDALHACAPGAMLAVRLTADELTPWLDGTHLASVNGERATVAAGPEDAIARLERSLADRGVPTRRLAVAHAFHTPAAAPATEALRRAIANVPVAPGRCLSGVDGAAFADLGPLVDALTRPVRFAEAARALAAEVDLLVEVGPGRTLTTLCADLGLSAVALDPQPEGEEPPVLAAAALVAAGHPGLAELLVAERWLADASDRDGLGGPRADGIGTLVLPVARPPSRPAVRTTTPADGPLRDAVVATISAVTGYPPEDLAGDADLEADLGIDSIRKLDILGRLQDRFGFTADPEDHGALARVDLDGLVTYVERRLVATPRGPTAATAGAWRYAELRVPAAGGDAAALPAPGTFALRGGHLVWRAPPRAPGPDGIGEAIATWLGWAAAHDGPERITAIVGDDPASAAASALVRSLGRERGVPVSVLEVAHGTPDDLVAIELGTFRAGTLVVRADRVLRRVPVPVAPRPLPGGRPVVLATGGATGIVVASLRALLPQRPRIAVLGRADLRGDSPRAIAGRAALDALRSDGADVLYLRCDVTDASAVRDAVSEVRARLGPIDVVVHGAGTLHDAAAGTLDARRLDEVLAPKLHGAAHLMAATSDPPPRAWVVFSSIAAHVGSPGQTAYAAANAALEAWPHPTAEVSTAFAWTAWRDVGMAAHDGRLASIALPPEDGAALFRDHLGSGGTVLAVMGTPPGDLPWPLFRVDVRDAAVVRVSLRLDPAERRLSDHRVAGRPLVAAAVWVAAVQAVAGLLDPQVACWAVDDFAIAAPTFVDHVLDEVSVELTRGDPVQAVIRVGDVRVATATVRPSPTPTGEAPVVPLRSARALYRHDLLFHGPTWQVLSGVSGDGNGTLDAELVSSDLGATASTVDAAYQLLATWSGARTGLAGLPVGAGRLSVTTGPVTPPVRIRSIARATPDGVRGDVIALDAAGRTVLAGTDLALRPAGTWPADAPDLLGPADG